MERIILYAGLLIVVLSLATILSGCVGMHGEEGQPSCDAFKSAQECFGMEHCTWDLTERACKWKP
jgi:hypothetical protein